MFSQSIGVRGGAKASGVRRCGRSGCGTVSARVWNVARVIGGIAFLSNFGVCSYIGGSNCRALDALSGGFRGCGKDVRNVAGVGQCGSLKVRKCANPCVFTINRSARGAES